MVPLPCLVLEEGTAHPLRVLQGSVAWQAAERFIAALRGFGRNVLSVPFFLGVSVMG